MDKRGSTEQDGDQRRRQRDRRIVDRRRLAAGSRQRRPCVRPIIDLARGSRRRTSRGGAASMRSGKCGARRKPRRNTVRYGVERYPSSTGYVTPRSNPPSGPSSLDRFAYLRDDDGGSTKSQRSNRGCGPIGQPRAADGFCDDVRPQLNLLTNPGNRDVFSAEEKPRSTAE